MFQSATIKLTAWYAGILMLISILFSIAIYQISLAEVNARITRFQDLVQTQTGQATVNSDGSLTIQSQLDPNGQFRQEENHEASIALLIRLAYINLVVLAVGSLASYLLARRTLRPVEEAHIAQTRFVSDTSHELRTPLAVMKSELEVSLRDPALTKKELRDVLKSNLEEVDNLARMSETLLAMSRMDTKKLPKQVLDLRLVVKEAMSRFKQPSSRLTLSGKPAYVIGNQPSLTELFMILIDNALKYSPAKSQVLITVGAKGTNAEVSITNDGDGIDAKALDHIFDRFYRADSSRTNSDQKGFGLGLAIAKQIADMHGAEITASSAPKEPTTFTYRQSKISRPKNPLLKDGKITTR
jgi:two-component system sensor histidine kinase CiaH